MYLDIKINLRYSERMCLLDCYIRVEQQIVFLNFGFFFYFTNDGVSLTLSLSIPHTHLFDWISESR